MQNRLRARQRCHIGTHKSKSFTTAVWMNEGLGLGLPTFMATMNFLITHSKHQSCSLQGAECVTVSLHCVQKHTRSHFEWQYKEDRKPSTMRELLC